MAWCIRSNEDHGRSLSMAGNNEAVDLERDCWDVELCIRGRFRLLDLWKFVSIFMINRWFVVGYGWFCGVVNFYLFSMAKVC